ATNWSWCQSSMASHRRRRFVPCSLPAVRTPPPPSASWPEHRTCSSGAPPPSSLPPAQSTPPRSLAAPLATSCPLNAPHQLGVLHLPAAGRAYSHSMRCSPLLPSADTKHGE